MEDREPTAEDIIQAKREKRAAAEYTENLKGMENVAGLNGPPPSEHIMQFFSYEHLPSPLAEISKPFCELAHSVLMYVPRNPERTAGLRKLLEAKDCIVRATLSKQ